MAKDEKKPENPQEPVKIERPIFGSRVYFWQEKGKTEIARELISETPLNASQMECRYKVTHQFKLLAVPADVVDQLRDGKWEVNQLRPRHIVYTPRGAELSPLPKPRGITFEMPNGQREYVYTSTEEVAVVREMTPEQRQKVQDTIKEKFPVKQRGELVGSSMRG